MKRTGLYFMMLLLMVVVTSCSKKGKSLITPVSSGRPYEVLVVADDQFWVPQDSALYRVLDTDVPGLPQPERSFRLSRVRSEHYDRVMRIFRNIIIIDVQPIYTQTKFKFSRDVYAAPQMIMTIQTPSRKDFDEYVSKHGLTIVDFFTKAEMNRQIDLLKTKHSNELSERVKKMFDCDIWMPTDLKAFKEGKDFLWSSTELNDMNFVMYAYPFRDNNTFTKDFFIHKRDSVMQANLPGSQPGMYMQTADSSLVEVKHSQIKGEYMFEAKGLWEMKGDAMGGPFVSQVRVDKKNARVIVVEGFVYNPGKLKRDLIRKLNAALYTLQLPDETAVNELQPSEQFSEEKIEKKEEKK